MVVTKAQTVSQCGNKIKYGKSDFKCHIFFIYSFLFIMFMRGPNLFLKYFYLPFGPGLFQGSSNNLYGFTNPSNVQIFADPPLHPNCQPFNCYFIFNIPFLQWPKHFSVWQFCKRQSWVHQSTSQVGFSIYKHQNDFITLLRPKDF